MANADVENDIRKAIEASLKTAEEDESKRKETKSDLDRAIAESKRIFGQQKKWKKKTAATKKKKKTKKDGKEEDAPPVKSRRTSKRKLKMLDISMDSDEDYVDDEINTDMDSSDTAEEDSPPPSKKRKQRAVKKVLPNDDHLDDTDILIELAKAASSPRAMSLAFRNHNKSVVVGMLVKLGVCKRFHGTKRDALTVLTQTILEERKKQNQLGSSSWEIGLSSSSSSSSSSSPSNSPSAAAARRLLESLKKKHASDLATLKTQHESQMEVIQEENKTLKTQHESQMEVIQEENKTLYSENKNFCSQVEVLEESKLCEICMDRNRDTVFMPCGHYKYCLTCVGSMQKCPYCSTGVVGRHRVFL